MGILVRSAGAPRAKVGPDVVYDRADDKHRDHFEEDLHDDVASTARPSWSTVGRRTFDDMMRSSTFDFQGGGSSLSLSSHFHAGGSTLSLQGGLCNEEGHGTTPEQLGGPSDGEDEGAAVHDRYELLEVIQSGGRGLVYSATERCDDRLPKEERQTYAVNVVDVASRTRKEVRRQRRVLKKLGDLDEHFLKIQSTFWQDTHSYVIYIKYDMSLPATLKKRATISERALAVFFRQACQGLDSIHRAGIVHRNVHPNTFVVVGSDETVKLADFELSSKQEPENGALMEGTRGKPPYMSPEMLIGKGFGRQTDMWSFGVCLYSLVLGQFPYRGEGPASAESMKEAIRKGVPEPSYCFADSVAAEPGTDLTLSEEIKDFIKACLMRLPRSRATSSQALDHPWMCDVAGLTVPFVEAQGLLRRDGINLKASVEAAGRAGVFLPDAASPNPVMVNAMEELQFLGAGCPTHACLSVYPSQAQFWESDDEAPKGVIDKTDTGTERESSHGTTEQTRQERLSPPTSSGSTGLVLSTSSTSTQLPPPAGRPRVGAHGRSRPMPVALKAVVESPGVVADAGAPEPHGAALPQHSAPSAAKGPPPPPGRPRLGPQGRGRPVAGQLKAAIEGAVSPTGS